MNIHGVLLLQIQETEQCYFCEVGLTQSELYKQCCWYAEYVDQVVLHCIFWSVRRNRRTVYLRAWCIFQDIWLVPLHLHCCISFLQMSHFSSFFLFYFCYIFINQNIRLTFRSHTLYHVTQGLMKVRYTDYWCKQMFLITEGFNPCNRFLAS